MNEIKKNIRDFFRMHINNAQLNDDSDIFQSSYVNSLFAIQIVNFIEKKFSIQLSNIDLKIDNFRTINNICTLIKKKLVSIG